MCCSTALAVAVLGRFSEAGRLLAAVMAIWLQVGEKQKCCSCESCDCSVQLSCWAGLCVQLAVAKAVALAGEAV